MANTRRAARSRSLALALALLVAGCSSGDREAAPPGTSPTATATPTVSPSPSSSVSTSPMAPVVDGLFPVAPGQHRLGVRCWGHGEPTVVYDAGTGDTGIGEATRSRAVVDLARDHLVCALDRAGTGSADPAPNEPRTLDDVVDDLYGVLDAAELPAPYVLVGSSGGGFDVYQLAGRHPEAVTGLVMLDVPRGQAEITAADVPAWDSIENPEHVDYDAVEEQMDLHRLPIPPVPVTVMTARDGQSEDPGEQRVWLVGSSHPRQVMIASGHDVFNERPADVVVEVRRLLRVLAQG